MKTKKTSRLKQVMAATRKTAYGAVTAAVDEAESVMLELVPVDEGDLKSTIEKADDGEGHASIQAGGPSKISEQMVDYVLPVEFGADHERPDGGNFHTPAQPFFYPAVEAGRRKMKEKLKITE